MAEEASKDSTAQVKAGATAENLVRNWAFWLFIFTVLWWWF